MTPTGTPSDVVARVLIAPDKFKGSLTAGEVAAAIGAGLDAVGGARIASSVLPLADGGDGSVQAAIASGMPASHVDVTGPLGDPLRAEIAFDGHTAVLESASICGLGMLPGGVLEPLRASSAGLGEAIRALAARGAGRIVIGLGGVATTDGGAGMLAALGVRLSDAAGAPIARPGGGDLERIHSLDLARRLPLEGVELVVASDVTNPLTGLRGAAHVFGPQKGADEATVERLDAALTHFASLVTAVDERLGALACSPGAGAAGGLGFALLVLGARVVSGADYFLDLLGFDEAVRQSDVVVTGEGSIDAQTADGKLVSIVSRRASGRPVFAAVGRSELRGTQAADMGLTGVFALEEMDARDTSKDGPLSWELLERIGRELGAQLLSAGGAGAS